MKPYESYPDSIIWNGVKYKLNLSYKAVLLVLDMFEDEQLSAQDKCIIALDILIKGEHPKDFNLLNGIFDLIRSDEPPTNEPKVIDINKDFDFIISSFRQAYGIDIVRSDLHYLEFISLLNGLPDGTKMVEIVKIRTMEVPPIDKYNQKQVQKLLELKAKYSLQDKANFNDGLAKLFNRLKGQVKHG